MVQASLRTLRTSATVARRDIASLVSGITVGAIAEAVDASVDVLVTAILFHLNHGSRSHCALLVADARASR